MTFWKKSFAVFRRSPTAALFTTTTKSTEPLVVTDVVGQVIQIAINRAEKRNCVNQETAEQLYKAFLRFEKDDSLHVAVLYGKGGNFCAGYDLSELSSFNKEEFDLEKVSDVDNGRGPMGPSRMAFSKPVIAAVSGYAVAGGLELACMCDLRLAEENSTFGVFCRRFGVPLLDGGTVRLPQLIGLSRALDMILTGRPVTAKEAYQMGLVNRVVPVGCALEEAMKLAKVISEFPQECLRRDRMSAFYSCSDAKSLKDALIYEHNNARHVIHQESIKGAKKFMSGIGKSGRFGDNHKSNL